ncbi:hypothetical protein A8C32_17545 [Flavivirga aquatica]|uniref:Uncharacterized protein n=1 Tax=Flavivirga aquatica TaxID=1849968 RepID=A0A1E5T8A0_9FLAO|nr:hypothetical protein [Flavivirga aquatica]OEK07601.1 hypothetical protein A8C32_17545 [Flavivirga aquatica]
MNNNNLHNIKSTGFTTSNDYFESFDEKMLSKLKNENYFDSIKNTGFKVSENYFDTLEDAIISKVSNEREPKVIQIFSKRNLVYISSMAAAILLLFNLAIFDDKPTFDSLDIETVENYIMNQNINSFEIASLLTDEELSEENFIQNQLEEKTIEDYILNNIEIEDLIIE